MKTRKTFTLVVALMALALAAMACSKGGTPTATAKAFNEAVRNKDAQGIKNSMSKGSLALMESFAKMQNKSLDDMLKEPSSTPPPANFESRNETITGDTATLEIKDEKGKWEKIPFVKEDGQWKLALDKAMQQGMSAEPGGSTGGDTGTGQPAEDNSNQGNTEHGGH